MALQVDLGTRSPLQAPLEGSSSTAFMPPIPLPAQSAEPLVAERVVPLSGDKSSSFERLETALDLWQENSPNKQEAIDRITRCYLNQTPTLNLASLNLRSLPDIFDAFPWITHLYLSFNRLRRLPRLPPLLDTLDLNNNQLTEFPVLPDSLDSLYISNNPLKTLAKLPPKLKTFVANGNHIRTVSDTVLPDSLETLQLVNNFLTSFCLTLPRSLKHLDISENVIGHFGSRLSNTQLTEINLSNNYIESLRYPFPSTLKKLQLNDNPIETLAFQGPLTLEEINLSNTPIRYIPHRLTQLPQSSWIRMENGRLDGNTLREFERKIQETRGKDKSTEGPHFYYTHHPEPMPSIPRESDGLSDTRFGY